jgi:hypothetical protein
MHTNSFEAFDAGRCSEVVVSEEVEYDSKSRRWNDEDWIQDDDDNQNPKYFKYTLKFKGKPINASGG